MDYQINYGPVNTMDTLGFAGAGTVEVTADAVRITGRRPNRTFERYTKYPAFVLIAVFCLLLLNFKEVNEYLSHTWYWVAIGWIILCLFLLLVIWQGRKRMMIFPLTALRQVMRQNENLTLVFRNDQGDDSTFIAHFFPASAVRDFATALETGQPAVNRVRFGYDVPSSMLIASAKGTLSLADNGVKFSDLRDGDEGSKRSLWLGTLIAAIFSVLPDMFSSFVTGRVIALIVELVLIAGLIIYYRRRRHPRSFSYLHITEIIPQGDLILLKVRDVSDRLREILFRLTDTSQLPMLLSEIQGRIVENKVGGKWG